MTHVTYQKIYQTDNLNQFFLDEYNRNISEKHVVDLMKSIERDNRLHLHPIIVDKKNVIKDGQHRLEACKRLKFPIYYVINENDKDFSIIDDQIQKRWFLPDFFKHYYMKKVPAYVKMQELMDTYGLDFQQIYIICETTKWKSSIDFREGKLRFTDKMLVFLTQLGSKQKEILEIYGNKNHIKNMLCRKDFVRALYKFYSEYPDKFIILLNALPNFIWNIIEKLPKASYESYYEYIKVQYNKHKGRGKTKAF